MPSRVIALMSRVLIVLIFLALLYLSAQVYLAGFPWVASATLIGAVLFGLTFSWRKAYTWRYLFPGLLGFGLFVIFPLAYTVAISFTNYSSAHLLSFSQVVKFFQEETYLASDVRFRFEVRFSGDEDAPYVLVLEEKEGGTRYASPPLSLTEGPATHELQPGVPEDLGDALALREVIQMREGIKQLTLRLPDGTQLTNTGLRDFGPRLPLWEFKEQDASFTNQVTGEVIVPDFDLGFYVTQASAGSHAPESVGPGFRTFTGFENYLRVLTDKGIQGPFIKIFIWTVVFAFGSVFLTLCVGMFLAVLLQWEAIKGREVYRTLLILPYAVPAFISILIFKGLFNQNFGEINMILDQLFGIKPEWFADPTLAKAMILMVNTWLGFPYMMIVCTGILQSVPDSIYEASAIDGSNAVTDFFRLTLPLIFPPLFPLLVASFAFNFNNFLLIYLLTGGGPDIVGSTVLAGETDILVSYTFRIAFQDAGKNFGYASAIATVIFIIVAVISYLNLRLQRAQQGN